MAVLRRALPLLYVASYLAFAAFWWVSIFDESSCWVVILLVIAVPAMVYDLVAGARRLRRWWVRAGGGAA